MSASLSVTGGKLATHPLPEKYASSASQPIFRDAIQMFLSSIRGNGSVRGFYRLTLRQNDR
jgi:hypothetical protein